jgi:hypothetical protein
MKVIDVAHCFTGFPCEPPHIVAVEWRAVGTLEFGH